VNPADLKAVEWCLSARKRRGPLGRRSVSLPPCRPARDTCGVSQAVKRAARGRLGRLTGPGRPVRGVVVDVQRGAGVLRPAELEHGEAAGRGVGRGLDRAERAEEPATSPSPAWRAIGAPDGTEVLMSGLLPRTEI
jgi:hypothetical protein